MLPTFLLKLPVKEIKAPEDHAPLDPILHVRLTLRHTVRDVKDSIAVRDTRIKPLLIHLKWLGASLNDSTTMASALGIDECPPFHNTIDALSVEIDWSLNESAVVPPRDPIPDLFDVLISNQVGNEHRDITFRETIFSTVGSIKEQVSYRLGLHPTEIVLRRSDNDATLLDETPLSDVLQLDVTPLEPLGLILGKKDILSIKITDLGSGSTTTISISYTVSLYELKSSISSSFGGVPLNRIRLYHAAHLVSDTSSTIEEQSIAEALNLDLENLPASVDVEFDIKDTFTTQINDEVWEPSGQTFTEIRREDGTKRLVDSEQLSSTTYEIALNGSSLVLTSSDMILNPDGYALFSPSGYHKLRNCLGSRLQHASRSEVNDEIPLASANHQANNTAEAFAPREPNQRGVFTRFYAVLRNNEQLWLQIGASLLGFAIFGGVEALRIILIPEIAVVLGILSFQYVFLVRGGDISRWLDDHILRDAPNRIDTRAVQLLSRVFSKTNYAYNWFFEFLSSFILSLIVPYSIRRNQQMAARVQNTDTWWYFVKETALELARLVVLFFATIVPSVAEAVDARNIQLKANEGEIVRKAIRSILQSKTATVPSSTLENALRALSGFTIEEAQDVHGEPEQILHCYHVVLSLAAMSKKQVEQVCLHAHPAEDSDTRGSAAASGLETRAQ